MFPKLQKKKPNTNNLLSIQNTRKNREVWNLPEIYGKKWTRHPQPPHYLIKMNAYLYD